MRKHVAQDEGYEYIPLDDYENFSYVSDIEIASTLVAKGFNLVSVDKISETKATFIFKKDKGLEETINGFWSNQIEVHPLEFANARKNLKSRIYGIRGFKNY